MTRRWLRNRGVSDARAPDFRRSRPYLLLHSLPRWRVLRSRGRRYRRTPAVGLSVTTRPPRRISRSPHSAISTATSRTIGISGRQAVPPTIRAASLGQIERSGCRLLSSARTAASTRRLVVSGVVGSHHACPRSPSATFASLTRRRLLRIVRGVPASRRARRAAISSFTSSRRKPSGIRGSDARHRRPLTMMNALLGAWPSRPSVAMDPSRFGRGRVRRVVTLQD